MPYGVCCHQTISISANLRTVSERRATFSERGPDETSGASDKRKPQTEDVIRCIYYNTCRFSEMYEEIVQPTHRERRQAETKILAVQRSKFSKLRRREANSSLRDTTLTQVSGSTSSGTHAERRGKCSN